MRNRLSAVRTRMVRALAVTVAATLTALVGGLATAAPAAAQPEPPWIIPPGGWCYHSWFTVTANHGLEHHRHHSLPVLSFTNATGTPATWHEQFQMTTTHTSTVTTTTTFEGGLDLGIIKATVTHVVQRQVVESFTIQHTTGFSTTVLPHSTKWAQYGAWRQMVTGIYGESKHECGTWNYETVTTGEVNASLVLADDPVGWHLWE